MLILQGISYTHADRELLFENVSAAISPHSKVSVIGNNGSGKSTLLKIIAGELRFSSGTISVSSRPYYIPQHFGQYDHLTVAQALGVEEKLNALKQILGGNMTEEHGTMLNDDWAIEERCHLAMRHWDLQEVNLHQPMGSLSGGQKTKVLLAGIAVHQPELILLDEPSNHLDASGRELLNSFIRSTASTLIIVSHDRRLLNLAAKTFELGRNGLVAYGGNYDFYSARKTEMQEALYADISSAEKELDKAKEKERETVERQQRTDSRGKSKQRKAGLPKIMMNTYRNTAENSTARVKGVHGEKIDSLAQELRTRRDALPALDKMRFGFQHSSTHRGKMLLDATALNYAFADHWVFRNNIDLRLTYGERISFVGDNGSGKTTLIRILLGDLTATSGSLRRSMGDTAYIDQDYSLITNSLTVYEQAAAFNVAGLPEHEIKTRLNRFLFVKADWEKSCNTLSGGQRMRLALCCLTIKSSNLDLIVLDEPTNNLDIQNIEILTNALKEFEGTLIVVSHDQKFVSEIAIDRVVEM